jgi:hypothetical protein
VRVRPSRPRRSPRPWAHNPVFPRSSVRIRHGAPAPLAQWVEQGTRTSKVRISVVKKPCHTGPRASSPEPADSTTYVVGLATDPRPGARTLLPPDLRPSRYAPAGCPAGGICARCAGVGSDALAGVHAAIVRDRPWPLCVRAGRGRSRIILFSGGLDPGVHHISGDLSPSGDLRILKDSGRSVSPSIFVGSRSRLPIVIWSPVDARIGIGARGNPSGPLPHHPACGSAPGGSES